MKKTNPLKIIISLIVFIIFVLVLNSCKKADDFKPAFNTTGMSDLERAKANVKNRIEKLGGIPQVFPVHKKMTTIWADKDGTPMDPTTVGTTNNFCANYDLPDYTNLLQYQRIYNCDQLNSGANPGYFIQFEYNVSWSKVIVATNSNSVSTEGLIRIVEDGGGSTVATYYVTGSDVTINDLGVDPNNSYNHIYNVKFDYSYANHSGAPIPTAYINGDISGTYTVKLAATFASSCPDDYSLWIVPAWSFGFTGNTGEHPCDRNDYPLFQDPSIFPGQHKIGIAGYDPTYACSEFGGNFLRTDLQQVEYSINNGATWYPFPNVLGGGSTTNPILQYGYLRYLDFAESPSITPGTYNVILRFKNWKYASVPNPLTIPSTGNGDCHSYGNPSLPSQPERDYAEWAYEYWMGVTI